ncbi:DNA topoisomerase II [Amanita rubescens]|nr:DNA topoisomerase II [Amanita rubescens]
MSSSEGDFEILSGSESDNYAPAKKAPVKGKAVKAPAKPKITATKSSSKGKSSSEKRILVERNDNAEDSDAEDNDQDAQGRDARQQDGPAKKKTASEMYTKLTQLEHILKRPDAYIGSVDTITANMWTFDSASKRMVLRDVKYVPGFYKIVDEILVNAADNKTNDPSMDTIRVNIDVEESTISVYNNGRGIPIEIHSKEKMHIPELIFGHLLASSNYDDSEKKLTGGRNGYGAKLANIYSHEFTIETAHKESQLKYKQTWTNNMSVCGKAKITKNAKGEEWTRVTFKPDLKLFGMNNIDEDTAGLLRKRVYDLAGTVKDVKVFLNDERIKVKNFKQYVEMYLDSIRAEAEDVSGAAQPKQAVVYEQIGPRWEIAFAVSDGSFQHVSFANSISTVKGGTHVTYIADQISKGLMTAIGKKNKAATVKPAQVKNHMWIFVNALIENPTFDSQTKETLTLPSSKFGSKPAMSEDFMKKVIKSSIIDSILNWAKAKADQQIKKTDGSKRSRILGLTKLSDANNAGTRHAKSCTLILTEGDSAKALAVAGLGVVGRDNFGVFPLRGKLLNVREARHDQIMKNEEVQNIKKIMGLQHNKDYTDTSSLRYGRLMLMTDQDHDGSHIKGLLINFLDYFYPSLLKLPEFLVEFVTPIVRVTKGKQRRDFFTIPEYEKWLEETPDAKKWDSKYFKGLGTSNDADARNYFSHMSKHMIPFAPTQEGDKELIELAFSKKKADDRKEWLRQFKSGTYLDHRLEEIPYSEFINKELILFSMADNIRSIPSVADGLKPGQRKVVWGCFKRKLKKEIKVAQLVGYISEHAAYHHGEQSLAQTIINLAQHFVGSNNLNLLVPNGQYGTRDQGGKDHASPRYIHTEPKNIARIVFNPADDPLLNQQTDDNQTIEPEFYVPIVPMVLINGAEGIGTGWSTNIPCYNPADVVANIRRLMKGEDLVPMLPWWRGFKGEIKQASKQKYDVYGIIRKLDDTTVEIVELPIHRWTQNYKADLESMMIGEKEKEGVIKEYKEHHDNSNVHFVVTMGAKELEKAEQQGLLEYFKLTGKINTSNMICFDFDGKIKKYDTPEEILEEFYPVRLAYYQKRKDHLAEEMQNILDKLNNQARFVQMIVDKELVVSNRKKADIVAELRKLKFRPFPKVTSAKVNENEEKADEDEEEEELGNDSDYDYLLGMAIWSLTKEKIEKLRQQANDKESELLKLLAKSPKDMWNEDLNQFLEAWEVCCCDILSKRNVSLTRIQQDCIQREEMHSSDSKGKKVKRKQAVLQTRKSLGGKKGSDDDDFVPIKPAAAKRKPPASKLAKSTVKEEGPSESEQDEGFQRKQMRTRLSKHLTRTLNPSGRQLSMKRVVEDSESDDDLFLDNTPPVRKAPIRAAPTKAKIESDDEMDVDRPKTKAQVKGKEKENESAKRKSPDSEEESDEFYTRPAKKQRETQATVTEYFGKASGSKLTQKMKPASPPKAKVQVAKADSDYEDLPRAPVSRRIGRGTGRKYIELVSSSSE